MKKRILAITGTRADYGIYHPVFRAIEASPGLELRLVVVGMHLKKEFGHTMDAIRADGFAIAAELDTLTLEDTPAAQARYVGRTLMDITPVLEKERPDVLLLLGDRGEQLAAAIAGAELSIPIAHLHGGETTGTVDDVVRNAVTQMARIHFATAEPHAEAIARMRGSRENVHVTGAPALDVVATFAPMPKEDLCRGAGLDPGLPILLLVQHPDPLDPHTPEEQLSVTLRAIAHFKGNIVIIGANADAGGIRMNAMLQEFAAAAKSRHFVMSLPHATFLSWEACADLLVGNSSSGIIEAASFRLPVVNVGDRQKGRLRSGNVLDVPYDAPAITQAIDRALHDESFRTKLQTIKNLWGDGHAAERIVKVLKR